MVMSDPQEKRFFQKPERGREMKQANVLLVLLLSSSLMMQGCVLLAVGAGAAAGAGTVAYIKGELQTTYAASLDRTWEGSLGALKDLNYKVISSQKDGSEGEIEANRAGEEKVKIVLTISGPGTTLVKIRVGIFGDKAVSSAINSAIASRLGVKELQHTVRNF